MASSIAVGGGGLQQAACWCKIAVEPLCKPKKKCFPFHSVQSVGTQFAASNGQKVLKDSETGGGSKLGLRRRCLKSE